MMEEPGCPAVCLSIAKNFPWSSSVSLSIDSGMQTKASDSGAVVVEVGVAVDGYDGDAVGACSVCFGLLAGEVLACGAADLHPAGAVTPTDG